MMMGRWAAARHNPLNGLDDWLEPRHAALDISLRALMTEHGYSAQAIELAAATVPGISIDDTSVLRMWQEETRGKLERSFTDGTRSGVDNPFGEANARDAVTGLAAISNIEGGCQQLPLAMAAQLGDAVRFHKRVSRIEMTNAGATISCMDGARFAASFVVSSIPFTMLRQVAIEATPNPVARAAIDEMPYANTARLYVTLEEPFWEADGLSPSFSTDGPLGMFWSIDNHGAGPHRAMIVLVGEAGEKIVSMDDAEAFLTNEMARLRPASKGKIKIAAYKDWKRDTLQLGCGFSLAPGQVNAFARDMIRPWQVMHFAGEHTRRTDFGMESAFESSERVVAEILQRV